MPTNRLIEKEKVGTYAAAMFDAANTAGGEQAVLEVRNQIEQVIKLMRSNMDLSTALVNVDYTPEERHQLVSSVFADSNPAFREVMAVMAERGDAQLLPRVFESYGDELAEKLDTIVVDVTTVVPLDGQLRETIKKKAEADLGKKVVLNEKIDKSILGGIIMSAGSKRIDASVLSQLAHARSVLKDRTDGGESQ